MGAVRFCVITLEACRSPDSPV